MGNGWHEWPLVIFTVLGQCVVGALIVSGIGWFAAKNDADRQRIVRGMFFLWLLMGVGFIASVRWASGLLPLSCTWDRHCGRLTR